MTCVADFKKKYPVRLMTITRRSQIVAPMRYWPPLMSSDERHPNDATCSLMYFCDLATIITIGKVPMLSGTERKERVALRMLVLRANVRELAAEGSIRH